MDPLSYCRDKVAPPGSAWHYALLFGLPSTSPARRRGVLGLLTLQAQILEISQRSRDPIPRAAQLAFWREQLAQIPAGTPTHPAAQLIAEACTQWPLAPELMTELLEAAAMDAEQTLYPDEKTQSLMIHRRSATLWMLLAEVLGYRDKRSLKFAHELGTALELARMILELGRDLAMGQLYLPLSALERHGISPEALLRGERPAQWTALLDSQLARFQEHRALAMSHLASEDASNLLPGLILVEIAALRLAKARRQGYPQLTQSVELAPLRLLWSAWRTARRFSAHRKL